jgi:hypothetical protein
MNEFEVYMQVREKISDLIEMLREIENEDMKMRNIDHCIAELIQLRDER